MFPHLFSIGPLTLHTYGFFLALAFVVAIFAALRVVGRLHFSVHQVLDMAVLMIPVAILGSRALYVWRNSSWFSENPLAAFNIWQGGLVFSGGVIAALMTLFLYSKTSGQSFWRAGDLWAPAAALGCAIGWIGCFMAGNCHGRPTDSVLGIVFTHPDSLAPINIPLVPTQIWGAAGGLMLAVILFKIQKKKGFAGQTLLWFLILQNTLLLWIEKYRGDGGFPISNAGDKTGRLIGFVTLITAVVALIVLKKRTARRGDFRDKGSLS